MAQIDPNGLCNAGCWFCPVSYAGNPESAKTNMSVEHLRSIVKQLVDGKGDFVSPDFNFIYTAHYNEVLLYKHFEEMLQIFREFGITTIVLSNGVPFTKARIDIIEKYQDVVVGICLNIPAAEEELWAKYTGLNPKLFEKMMANIQYAIEVLPKMFANKSMSIQINGVDSASLVENGGWLTLLEDAPPIDLDIESGDLARQHKLFLERFPGINAYKMNGLIDRAGHLDTAGVITNISGIKTHFKPEGKTVVGCSNGQGGRTTGWIHINPNGDVFICCNDFDFDTVFGNTLTTPIKDIWMSFEHKEAILDSYKGFCTTCAFAVWK
ncbi:Radical_SAM domain containing protein [uncultured Caudovirales phage]|uniref:Radical_SAM domain containing protein n=1 Tax=uncultured Caudovirales phage TaxID=2100421 RepID=A0A6J5RAW2_9CAUD|nr:Radical_SAM domain containing protein [uncultured Caudovirales phage]CAB4179916.1 Radical_SAM domain containing protein [uncultured Caudovirales phage]CAB4188754.1 Radical_SAM domain containing protein [uncultured Caudovirales phage]